MAIASKVVEQQAYTPMVKDDVNSIAAVASDLATVILVANDLRTIALNLRLAK